MSSLYYSQYLGKQEPLCKWYHLTSYGQGTGELSFVIVNKVDIPPCRKRPEFCCKVNMTHRNDEYKKKKVLSVNDITGPKKKEKQSRKKKRTHLILKVLVNTMLQLWTWEILSGVKNVLEKKEVNIIYNIPRSL